MRKRLMNNLGLKIVALLFAAILWLMVVNINDPVEKKTYREITVRILHSEIITNRGKTYRVQNDSNKVSVVVTAKRSVLEKIEASNIVATADVRDMELSTLLPVKISITGFEGDYRSATATPNNVEIAQEQSISGRYPIVVDSTGTLQDGYVLDEMMAQPVSVQLSGPKSLVGRIDKVVAKVNIDGISEDCTLPADLILYDGGGNVLDQTSLESNLSGSENGRMQVNVRVKLLSTKTVPIELDTSQIGTAAEYKVSDVSCEPERIQIAGKETALEALDKLELPAEALAMDNISTKTDRTIDLTKYLPNGIRLANENEKNIIVTVSIERQGMKTFDVPVDSIQKYGLQSGFKVSFTVQELELHFTGEEEALEKLTLDQVQENTYIDLQKYTKEGTYTVPVQVNVRDGCSLAEAVIITVKLEKQEAELQNE